MNRPRSFEQRLEAWLEEGPASAPPDLLAEVLDSVPHDNPRRRRGGVRRLQMLSSFARFGAAVAAILVIGVVGISLLESRFPGVGGPGTSASRSSRIVPAPPTSRSYSTFQAPRPRTRSADPTCSPRGSCPGKARRDIASRRSSCRTPAAWAARRARSTDRSWSGATARSSSRGSSTRAFSSGRLRPGRR